MVASKQMALLACVLGMFLPARGEGPYGIGARPTQAQIAGWNIDVAPDGQGLPPGQGSVSEGKALYGTSCASCHGDELQGGLGPALRGGAGSLASAKPFKTVGSYWPYATTLFDYIRRAMPLTAPQSLNNDEVYALVGYVLSRNGILPADAVVDAAVVSRVRMPNRDGFYVDDRPDVTGPACYQHCLTPAARGHAPAWHGARDVLDATSRMVR